MTPDDPHGPLAGLIRARDRWLADTIPALKAKAVWLTGSIGEGRGDAWSDLDLLVVDGSCLLDDALLTLELPQNGPSGGRYVGAMYDLGELPLWVDWYEWPSTAPIPTGSRLLAGSGSAGRLNLADTLTLVGRGVPGPSPDPDTFALAMLPLAAKFVARGDVDKATPMAAMLEITPDAAGLYAVLARVRGHNTARARVAKYLDVVSTYRESASRQ
ncbi:hypothetical protein Kfla_0648 [Kribbella flavida DSM 17836]|uniref:Polymerase nucleotidyl transferase domain-containing protein n=1 Tax=Kribbella flavida (strain DSM 17836 / JCM 10339 / NBRC 14399) TaxID=479435 RepID=D2PXC1_KRIFD|nr:hypothetical protein [Kribbella flavida]ADB29769.1 hypothetical protein Kfla_0648 [Kribbella flavida DSM 17836]